MGSISAAVRETSPHSSPEQWVVIKPKGLIKDSYFRGCHFFYLGQGPVSQSSGNFFGPRKQMQSKPSLQPLS